MLRNVRPVDEAAAAKALRKFLSMNPSAVATYGLLRGTGGEAPLLPDEVAHQLNTSLQALESRAPAAATTSATPKEKRK